VSQLAARSRSRSTLTGSAFTGPFQSQSHFSQSSTLLSNRIDTRNTNANTTVTLASPSHCYALQQVSCCSSHAKDKDTPESASTSTNNEVEESTDSTLPAASESNDTEKPFEIPGAQKGGRKLAIVFTCTVCDTRSAKQFTEQAYTNGVVLVRCPGCENLHLIADRLGYFQEEDWDLESLVQQKGEKVRTITDQDVWELTLEDLVGTEKMNKVLQESASIKESEESSSEQQDEKETAETDDPQPKA
jgi:hypothetical protein